MSFWLTCSLAPPVRMAYSQTVPTVCSSAMNDSIPSASSEVNINKGIMFETLTNDNQVKQDNAKEIGRLRQKIKDLGGEPD